MRDFVFTTVKSYAYKIWRKAIIKKSWLPIGLKRLYMLSHDPFTLRTLLPILLLHTSSCCASNFFILLLFQTCCFLKNCATCITTLNCSCYSHICVLHCSATSLCIVIMHITGRVIWAEAIATYGDSDPNTSAM